MSEVQETTATQPAERAQTPRTQKVGKVVSDKMDKTIVVSVDFVRTHPLYKKRMRRTSKFFAHDENGTCQVGDTVRIEECAPISKRKRWIVREILERAVQV